MKISFEAKGMYLRISFTVSNQAGRLTAANLSLFILIEIVDESTNGMTCYSGCGSALA